MYLFICVLIYLPIYLFISHKFIRAGEGGGGGGAGGGMPKIKVETPTFGIILF